MAETSFADVQKGFASMAEQMKAMHANAQGVSNAFSSAFHSLLPVVLDLKDIANLFPGITRAVGAMRDGLSLSAEQLMRMRREAEQHLVVQRLKGEITEEQYLALIAEHDANKLLHLQQVELAREVEKVGRVRLYLATLMIGAIARMRALNAELNQDLINANSSWMTRKKLMYDTLLVQAQLGATFGKATEVARALVFYGLEDKKNFVDVVKTVVRLNEGLGMSVENAAELATIVEQRIHGDFEQVANVMAQLVNSTALTADEAGRLASNLARVMETVRPGVAATALPEITKLVGGYESALKRLGGQAGTVEQFLSKLTTPEGLTAAGILGVQSPEFLTTQAGVEQVMKNFQAYGEGLLQNAEGWDRRWRLDALGQQMGMNADQVSMLLQVMKEQSKETAVDIDIQTRFNQQLGATGASFVRLANSLMGLIGGGLYPFVVALNSIADALNWAVQGILKFKALAYTAMATVTVAAIGLTGALSRLAAQMWRTAVAAAAASASGKGGIFGSLLSGLGTALTGGFRGAMMGLGRLLLGGLRVLFATHIGLLITVLGGGLFLIYRELKKNADMVKEAESKRAMMSKTTTGRGLEALFKDIRFGDTEWLRSGGMKQVQRWLEGRNVADLIPGWEKMDVSQRMQAQNKLVEDQLAYLGRAQYMHARFDRPLASTDLAATAQTNALVMQEMRDLFKTYLDRWNAQVVKEDQDKKDEEVRKQQEWLHRRNAKFGSPAPGDVRSFSPY